MPRLISTTACQVNKNVPSRPPTRRRLGNAFVRLVSILKRQFGMPLAAKPVVRGKFAETLVSVAARHVVRDQVALVMGENENSAPF